MDNETLERIKNFAIEELKREYVYCGVAEGKSMAMINSDDKSGSDIKITIELVPNG